MPRDPRVQLNDIELAVRRILDKAGSTSLENYLADRDLLDIVERQMIIIGEAASQLKKQNTELADCLPDISQIIGFRHRVVHGLGYRPSNRVPDHSKRLAGPPPGGGDSVK